MNDKGLFGIFDYERDVMQPPIEDKESTDTHLKAVESVDLNNFRAIAEEIRHGI